MLTRGLVAKLFETSTMQRWTDHARPISFTILGKHAHMMTAAWVYGRCLVCRGQAIDWPKLIDYGVFELLRKAVLTDIKSQVFRGLNRNRKSRDALMGHVEGSLRDDLRAVSIGFFEDFVTYFREEADDPDSLGVEYQLLRCVSNYATRWEYDIISKVDTVHYIGDTRKMLDDEEAQYEKYAPQATDGVAPAQLAELLHLCGRLRFQDRWAQTPIIPRRPVLDHQLMVAALTHLSTRDMSMEGPRTNNNFFGALFHDLGEILTRDIVSPVKNISSRVQEVIDHYEADEFEKHIAPLVPDGWKSDLRRMVLKPFTNKDDYDGDLVKVCDNFAAFLEAYYSIKYGTYSPELKKALLYLYEHRRKLGPSSASRVDLMVFDVAYELCFHEVEPRLREI